MLSMGYASIFILKALRGSAAAVLGESPDVIPGPGLPSLRSLNLTLADFREMPIPEMPMPPMLMREPSIGGEILTNPQCGPEEGAYTHVNNLIYCFHYLQKLGTTRCEFKRNKVKILCLNARSGIVIGLGVVEDNASSYCSDVALGLLAVIDGCTRPDMSVAGFAAADGNGNIMVGGTNVEYAKHRVSV